VSTAGQIIDRVYREYLYRPDDQPVRTTITADVAVSDPSFSYVEAGLTTEEVGLFTVGTLVEVNQELMRITGVSSNLLNVVRGESGTTAAAHSASSTLYVAPEFPRRVVADAVSDSIVDLYPDLWHTESVIESLGRDWIEVPAATTGVLSAMIQYGDVWLDAGVRFLHNFPDSRTNQAVQVEGWTSGRVMLELIQKFTRPASEATVISDIEEDWEQLVVVGAVVNILSATDVDAHRQDYMTETFQAQGYPVGSGERLSRAAIRLYEYKLDKAKRELARRYPIPVVQSGVTYGGF